ncbi:eL24 family ribosomal protein [Lacipirellula limnantheis]|uniref:YHS domain protein n=1 Tax=Lacipirellula limnantheis TaxID=2528024 RepID=A0A517TTM9_9BACT|nr:hypothetical protein [Lacipirellula limnantheis]QDT71727.1 YHS domain protein [Lacipirellula limnantheis]
MRYTVRMVTIWMPIATAAIALAALTLRDASPPGLDGYCPVALVEEWRWAHGDSSIVATFEGCRYWFSSDEALTRFRREPVRYTPALAGVDPVLWLDEGRRAPGTRKFGVEYARRIWLFASEQTLHRFVQSPSRYVVLVAKSRGHSASPSKVADDE